MSLFDSLKPLGVDTETGLKHFKDNADIFEKLLRKFPESVEGRDVLTPLKSGDIKQAYEQAHALKGICANLYITSLYELYAKVSDSLKSGNSEGLDEILEKAAPLQEKIINIIESA